MLDLRTLPDSLTAPAIGGRALFPHVPVTPGLRDPRSLAAVDAGRAGAGLLAWVPLRDLERPFAADNLHDIGTLVEVGPQKEAPGHTLVKLNGVARCRVADLREVASYAVATCTPLVDPPAPAVTADDEARLLRGQRALLGRLDARRDLAQVFRLALIGDAGRLADTLAFHAFHPTDAAEVLQRLDPVARLDGVLSRLHAHPAAPLADVPEFWDWTRAHAYALWKADPDPLAVLQGLCDACLGGRAPAELHMEDLAIGLGQAVRSVCEATPHAHSGWVQ